MLRLPWWLQYVLMSINGKMKRLSDFGIIIAKTRGHVLSATSELDLMKRLKKAYESAPA